MSQIRPQAGRQEQFLTSSADIVIYGGAAGGGKSYALLLDPLRDTDVNGFYALCFRKTYPEITNAGGLWDESEKIYPHAGGQGVKGDLVWRFPHGSRVEFGHLQHDDELKKYDGAQITDLLIDQLEHFSEKAFWYLLIRNRSTCVVPSRMRATCNPPDPKDEGALWLRKLLDWWIGKDGYADMERAGCVRWFVRWAEELYWADTRDELIEYFYPEEVYPLSMTFIPATVYDNRILMARDPAYLARLQAQSLVERERFLGDKVKGGNWNITASAGKVFNRDWFSFTTQLPAGGLLCDGWDLAATAKKLKGDDPDFTAKIRMHKGHDGIYTVTDFYAEQLPAGEVESQMHAQIITGRQAAQGMQARYLLRWETEPGSAAVREADRMKRAFLKDFPGLDCEGIPSTADKVGRAGPLSSAAEHGKVRLLVAPWNDLFLTYYHGFPDLKHDDPVDGGTLAYNTLEPLSATPPPPPVDNNRWRTLKSI